MADVAALVFEIDSSQARTAATDLAKVQQAAVSLTGRADALNKTMRDSRGRFISSAQSVKQYGSEVYSLAAKYNHSLRAVYDYQRAEVDLNRAVALGVVTRQQADVALEQTRAELARTAVQADATAGAMRRMGAGMGMAGANVRNLGYQVNDIAMMTIAGQAPLMLMAQQGFQVIQVMGDMRASGQTMGTALRSVFTQLLNPMNLVTLGVIAGGVALTQWAMSALGAKNETVSLDDAMTNLSSAISSYSSAVDAVMPSLSELRIEYGHLAEAAKLAFEQQVRLREFTLLNTILDSQAAIAGLAGDMRSLHNEWVVWSGVVANSNGDLGQFVQGLDMVDGAAQAMTDTFGMAIHEAKFLLDAVNDWQNASGPVELQAATTRLNAAIITAVDSGAMLPPEMIAFANEAANANLELIDMIGLLGQAAATAAGIVIPVPPGMTFGSGTWSHGMEASDLLPPAPGVVNDRTRRRGGGKSEAEKLAEEMKRRWDALNEGFLAETALAQQHYITDIETLKWALDQKKITQEEYDAFAAQHSIATWGAQYQIDQQNYALELAALNAALEQKYLSQEQYIMRVRALQDEYYMGIVNTATSAMSQELSGMAAHFQQMNTLAGGGYDKLMRAQQTFQAASALMNAWTGYTQALADPTLPWWAKFAAAGKVLAAGIGAANAIKGGGRGGGASAASGAAPRQEPTRNVLVHLDGPDWMVDMADSIITQIYEQSENGRVIVSRGTN